MHSHVTAVTPIDRVKCETHAMIVRLQVTGIPK